MENAAALLPLDPDRAFEMSAVLTGYHQLACLYLQKEADYRCALRRMEEARAALDSPIAILREFGIIVPVPAVVDEPAPLIEAHTATLNRLAEAQPRICPGWKRHCGKPFGRHSKTGLCLGCIQRRRIDEMSPEALAASMQRMRAGRGATTSAHVATETPVPAPVEATPIEVSADIDPEEMTDPSVQVGDVDDDIPLAPPQRLPIPTGMPTTDVTTLMKKATTLNSVSAARAAAIHDTEAKQSGVCTISWEFVEEGRYQAWEIKHSPWEVAADSIGVIEILRRTGKDWVSDATGQVVGRV